MLARLQQGIVAGLVLLAAGWLWWSRHYAVAVVVAGLLLLAIAHAVFLAGEFVLVHRANRKDPAPRADARMLLSAWLAESVVAPRVFLWRQPFRSRVWPDHLGRDVRGRRGVVLIHGFVCNRGLWNPWLHELRLAGHAFVAVNLEPVFGSIDDYVPIIDDAVQRVADATGMAPLVVCHSMGGLAARAWLRDRHCDARVHRVVTIGTPHHGTWPGQFSHVSNGRQMRLNSDWLQQLAANEPPVRASLFTCYYSNCDNIVFPASGATLAGADNRFLPGVAHVAMAFDARVVRETMALLDATRPAPPGAAPSPPAP